MQSLLRPNFARFQLFEPKFAKLPGNFAEALRSFGLLFISRGKKPTGSVSFERVEFSEEDPRSFWVNFVQNFIDWPQTFRTFSARPLRPKDGCPRHVCTKCGSFNSVKIQQYQKLTPSISVALGRNWKWKRIYGAHFCRATGWSETLGQVNHKQFNVFFRSSYTL